MQNLNSVANLTPKEACLIIEDSQFDQKKLTRVLSRGFRNLEILCVDTLKSARELLENTHVSMILLDNNLPDGHGADFSMELAADPRFSKMPVIMVSDWPTPFMWDKAQSAGVLYVLKKSEFNSGFVRAALLAARKLNRRPTVYQQRVN